MRRARLLILVLVLLAVAVLAGGYRVLNRLAPERLRSEVETRLGVWLGVPVEVGQVRPVLLPTVGLEARTLRSGAEAEGPGIEVDRASVTLDLGSLLLGRLDPRWVELSGVRVRVARTETGEWLPPALARLAGTPERVEQQPEVGEWLGEAARLALRIPPTVPSVRIEDAELRWLGGAPDARSAREPLALTEVRARFGQRPFGRGLWLRAEARLGEAAASGGNLGVEAELRRSGNAELTLELEEADLAVLQQLAARWVPLRRVTGRANGWLRWSSHAESEQRLAVELEARPLELDAAPGDRPLRLRTRTARLELDARAEPERLGITRLRLATGGGELRARGSLGLPLGEASRTDFVLDGRDLSLARAGSLVESLLPAGSNALGDVAAGLDAGRVASLTMVCRGASLADWRRLAGDPLAWPAGLGIELELVGATLRLPGGSTLTDLSGGLAWNPQRLEIRDAVGVLAGSPLPRLDLRVVGLEHLRGARRPKTAPARSPLPGRKPLWDWIAAQRRPGSSPSWSHVDVDAEWLDHPALPWPLSDLRARIEPAEAGVSVRLAQARWGGIPVQGQGSIGGAAPGRVAVTLEAAAPDGAPRAVHERSVWGRGRVVAQLQSLGGFPVRQLEGRFRGSASRLELHDARLTLAPEGLAEGDLLLDLSEASRVPFEVRLQVQGAPIVALAEGLKLPPDGVTGQVVGGAYLRGGLVAGRKLLEGAEGPISFHARNGEVRRRLPAVIAIATAGEAVNPFQARETLPYEALDAELRLAGGRLEADSLTLDGPALRMVATGRVDVVEPPHEMEAVVGIFFFPILDTMIGKVPVLNRLLLGPDQNLVSGYFALTGPWESPQANLIASKSLATGPASLLLEGVPSFVRGGLDRIQGLVGGLLRSGGGPS